MKKRSFGKILLNIAILIAVVASISWVLNNNKKKNEEKTAVVAETNSEVAVRIHQVAEKNMNLDFKTNGNFSPIEEIDYASENSGRVVKILVKEGSYVRRGQTLAIVDAGILNIDLESAKAALANAERDQQRFENAFKTGGVTQQQLDQIKLTVENAQARVNQAKIRTNDANIRSSINGIVNKKYIETGAYVSPGTRMFELVDISKLKLIVNVNEYQVTQIKMNDKVEIVASVYPDKTFDGRVSFIGNKADAALNFPIEIEVNNNENQLKAGMYGTAQFHFSGERPSVVIPRSAFAGSVSSNEVFVLTQGNIAKLKKVTSGRIIGDEVEILNGLESGDKIITSGQINLNDGSKVAVINETSSN